MWRLSANCAGLDVNDFYSEDDGRWRPSLKIARQVCQRCDVRAECLADALAEEGDLTAGYRFGLRGGLTPTERATVARSKTASAAPTPF